MTLAMLAQEVIETDSFTLGKEWLLILGALLPFLSELVVKADHVARAQNNVLRAATVVVLSLVVGLITEITKDTGFAFGQLLESSLTVLMASGASLMFIVRWMVPNGIAGEFGITKAPEGMPEETKTV